MNKIWDCKTNELIEMPEEMKKFLEEIETICKKYNLSISHEDEYGAFEIVEYHKAYIEWLQRSHKKY